MVARILVVDEQKLDLSRISIELQLVHNSLLFSKSIEDALRIVSTQSIDVVLVSLPQVKSKLFLDFFFSTATIMFSNTHCWSCS
jgi:hypothetical protein